MSDSNTSSLLFQPILASVEDKYRSRVKYLSYRLKRKGFKIKKVLPSLGIILADAPGTIQINQFKMKGIKHLELDGIKTIK